MTVTALAAGVAGVSQTTHDVTVTLTAGGTCAAFLRTGSATTVTCAFSDGSHSFTALGPDDNGAGRQYLFRLENTPGGSATIRFTLSAAGQPRWDIVEIPDALSSSFDVSAANTGTGTAITGGTTATTAQADEEAIGGFSNGGAAAFTQNGGWLIVSVDPASPNSRIGVVHQRLTATGTPQAAVDQGASNAWICRTATFRVASAASVSDPTHNRKRRAYAALLGR